MGGGGAAGQTSIRVGQQEPPLAIPAVPVTLGTAMGSCMLVPTVANRPFTVCVHLEKPGREAEFTLEFFSTDKRMTVEPILEGVAAD